MFDSNATKQILGNGLRQSLLRWLVCQHSLSANVQSKLQYSLQIVPLVLSLLGCIAGLSSMVGVMALGAKQQVNLLLLMAIFVVLPAFLSVVSVTGVFRRAASLFTSVLSPWLEHRFSKVSNSLVEPRDHELALRWLNWQSHLFSISFLVSALLAFLLMVTLQDYQFAWSTTVQAAVPIVEQVLWWFTFVFQPIVQIDVSALISASQSQQGEFPSSIDTGAWWLLLSLMILLYGLGFRVVALLVARFRYRRLIVSLIERSQVIAGSSIKTPTVAHDTPSPDTNKYPIATLSKAELRQNLCLAWQASFNEYSRVTLGLSTWQDDITALKANKESIQLSTVCILVRASSIPTAELADIVRLMHGDYQAASVKIVVMIEQAETFHRNQLSWQAFAQRQQIALAVYSEAI